MRFFHIFARFFLLSWRGNIAVSLPFHWYSKWTSCIRRNPRKKAYQISAALLKKTSHGMSLSAASDVPWYRDIVSSGFLPKRCHSTSAIENQSEKASLQENAIRCSLHTAILSSYTTCGEPRQTTPLGLQAPPDKLDPGRSVKHLAVENNWTFGDFCCLFAVWDWQSRLLNEGDRWEDGEQRCGWIFQAEQAAGVQTCHLRKRDGRGEG